MWKTLYYLWVVKMPLTFEEKGIILKPSIWKTLYYLWVVEMPLTFEEIGIIFGPLFVEDPVLPPWS